MGFVQSWTCDICGTLKKETNHWFMAGVAGDDGKYLRVEKFDEDAAKYSGRTILCGEGCVHKFISQNIQAINPVKGIEENHGN